MSQLHGKPIGKTGQAKIKVPGYVFFCIADWRGTDFKDDVQGTHEKRNNSNTGCQLSSSGTLQSEYGTPSTSLAREYQFAVHSRLYRCIYRVHLNLTTIGLTVQSSLLYSDFRFFLISG